MRPFEPSRGDADVLLAARKRGVHATAQLIRSEGGCLTVRQLGELYGLTPQAIRKRRQSGAALAVRFGRNCYLYPAWQFASDGAPLVGMKPTLDALVVKDVWMRINFFLTPDTRLDGRRPLDVLRAVEIDSVIAAAATFGEHGAA